MIKRVLSQIAVLFLKFLALFPLGFLYLGADILYIIIYKILRYRIHVVKKNLCNSFPEKSNKERQEIEQLFYRQLAEKIIETIKMPRMRVKDLEKRVVFKNTETFEKLFANGENFVACSGHLGNWEWATAAFALRSGQQKYHQLNIYKQLNNQQFDKYIRECRNTFGGEAVEMKQTLRRVLAYQSERFCVVLAADQSPASNDLHFFTTFMHQRTPVYLGVEKIAKKMDLPVLFFHTHRIKRGYYQVICELISSNSAQSEDTKITLAHVKTLEKALHLHPENWLWSHNRWKHSQAHS